MKTLETRVSRKQGVGAVSRSSLEDLYLSEGAGASKLALLLTRDRAAAEDVVQEAFTRIAGRLFALRSKEHARAYLYRTVINLCHARGRELKRATSLAERSVPHNLAAEPDARNRDDMWRALTRLPERQRAALFFRFYMDESEAMAAESMGCSVSALKSLVHRGLNELRTELERSDG